MVSIPLPALTSGVKRWLLVFWKTMSEKFLNNCADAERNETAQFCQNCLWLKRAGDTAFMVSSNYSQWRWWHLHCCLYVPVTMDSAEACREVWQGEAFSKQWSEWHHSPSHMGSTEGLNPSVAWIQRNCTPWQCSFPPEIQFFAEKGLGSSNLGKLLRQCQLVAMLMCSVSGSWSGHRKPTVLREKPLKAWPCLPLSSNIPHTLFLFIPENIQILFRILSQRQLFL